MKEYKLADFDTTAPYEELAAIKDPFQQGRALRAMAEQARAAGCKGFMAAWKDYQRSLKMASAMTETSNVTQYEEQMLELDTGEWEADDTGVWRYGGLGGMEIACSHPIMPIERLRNIDTGELKVKLAFRRGNKARKVWNEIVTDFDTVSNAKNIVSLSRIGVSVTSGKRAQNLVDFLTDVMDRNYDVIPERKSVSRMGWNEEGFSPYVEQVVFDGNDKFERIFNAIRPHGIYQKWLDEALDARAHSITARVVLATSFASVLVGPMGCLPFFVHLWGMDSGTGENGRPDAGRRRVGQPVHRRGLHSYVQINQRRLRDHRGVSQFAAYVYRRPAACQGQPGKADLQCIRIGLRCGETAIKQGTRPFLYANLGQLLHNVRRNAHDGRQ